jgi:hypothetical protein
MFDVRRHAVPVACLATLVAVLMLFGAAGPARALTFTASAGSPVAVAGYPFSIAVGDLNTDGKPDLATANQLSNDVTMLLGDGAGGFTPATGSPFAVGTAPQSVAIGDLNADGKPDLVTANGGTGNVTVLLGDGGGGFTSATGFLVGTAPYSVAIGDLNADGKPDLATANNDSSDVTVLLGDGAGGFTPATDSPFSAGAFPHSVAIGDLNADGKADLATANYISNDITVLLGDGSGGFTPAPRSPFAVGLGPSQVAIGDLNADGKPDLATANLVSSNVTVLLGDGRGGFTPAMGSPFVAYSSPQSVAIGDLNSDGKPDLATANAGTSDVTVLLGNGGGGFTPATGSPFPAGMNPSSVAIADLNADGKPDLATANAGSNNVTVLVNASVAARTVSSSSLTFGSQPQSTLSGAQTMTVTGGDVPLKITRIARTGADRGEFLLSDDTCSGQTLAHNDSCTVDVRFAPTSPGAKSATLSITDNTASAGATTLSGTGGDLPTGPVGPIGPIGPAGTAGTAGPVGPIGPIGPAGTAGTAGPLGTAGAKGPTGARGPRGATGPSTTVTCKVTKTTSTKKIKVTCTVKTKKAATARLTSNGRTIARRTLKAGTRHATFTVTNPSHTRHYRLKITPAS